MVHWSGTSFLNWPVAEGGPEQPVVVGMALAGFAVLGNGLEMSRVVESLSFDLRRELVVEVLLLNLLVLSEGVESALSDGNHLLNDVPEDALAERSGGEATWVTPSSVEVEHVNELGEVDQLGDAVLTVVLNHLPQELVVEVIDDLEIFIRDDLEQEAEDTVGELRATLLIRGEVRLDGVHNMKLHVHELSVNTVLRRSVEVVLHSGELDILASEVLVEQTSCLGEEVVVASHGEEEAIALLVELLDCDGVLLLVLEDEGVVLEILLDVQIGWQVDGGLLGAHGANFAWLGLGQVEVLVALALLLAEESLDVEVELEVLLLKTNTVGRIRHDWHTLDWKHGFRLRHFSGNRSVATDNAVVAGVNVGSGGGLADPASRDVVVVSTGRGTSLVVMSQLRLTLELEHVGIS